MSIRADAAAKSDSHYKRWQVLLGETAEIPCFNIQGTNAFDLKHASPHDRKKLRFAAAEHARLGQWH
eukprot:5090487-Pleurochrysis_carterae.AAC.1